MTSLIFKNSNNNVTNIVPGSITSNVNLTLPNSNGTLATTADINNAVTNANNTMLNKSEYPGVNITGVVKTTNQMVRLFVGPNSKYKTLWAAIEKALQIKAIITRTLQIEKITIELENNFVLRERIAFHNVDLTGICIKGKDDQFCNVIIDYTGVTNKSVIELNNSRGLEIANSIKFISKENTSISTFMVLSFCSTLKFSADVDVNISGTDYILLDAHSDLMCLGSTKGTRTHNVRYKIGTRNGRYTIRNIKSLARISNLTMHVYIEELNSDENSFIMVDSRERGILSTGGLNINLYNTTNRQLKHMEILEVYSGGVINYIGGIITNVSTKTKRLDMLHVCNPGTIEFVSTEFKDFREDENINLLQLCTIHGYGVLSGRDCKFTNIGRIKTSTFPMNVVNNVNVNGLIMFNPSIDNMLPQKY